MGCGGTKDVLIQEENPVSPEEKTSSSEDYIESLGRKYACGNFGARLPKDWEPTPKFLNYLNSRKSHW